MKESIKSKMEVITFAIAGASIGAVVLFSIIMAFVYIELWTSKISGQAKFNKAEITRQIAVIEAQAKLDSSTLLAKSEVERAKGVAEANKIIGDSLKGNESYLRYLWIDSLQHTKDKIIYVPTEAGLPLLESTRLNRK